MTDGTRETPASRTTSVEALLQRLGALGGVGALASRPRGCGGTTPARRCRGRPPRGCRRRRSAAAPPTAPGSCDCSGASSRVRRAASSWPMSRRAPDSTSVISAFAAVLKFATAGLLASLSACSGCPSARWQSAMIGQIVGGAVHPLGGAQLGERLGVVTRGVRRLTRRLAHHRQPGGPRPGRQRVLVRRLRVGVDHEPGRGQVTRHPERQLVGQTLQLTADAAVELAAGDLLGQRRTVVTRLLLRARHLLLSAGRDQSPLRAGRPSPCRPGALPPGTRRDRGSHRGRSSRPRD